ncbi:hypothetical protein TIFTF001_011803 [Ficus carica]|uniref:Uncharacterized protein n=1 Tax=Ficus carica TaxID=3494 RepID=A0AA87ZUV1_FICCA|nr:hypothetical protein TIFTF001_011803 [Ficus carica]
MEDKLFACSLSGGSSELWWKKLCAAKVLLMAAGIAGLRSTAQKSRGLDLWLDSRARACAEPAGGGAGLTARDCAGPAGGGAGLQLKRVSRGLGSRGPEQVSRGLGSRGLRSWICQRAWRDLGWNHAAKIAGLGKIHELELVHVMEQLAARGRKERRRKKNKIK